MKKRENKLFFRQATLVACLLAGVCSCKKDGGSAEFSVVGAFTAVTESHTGDGKSHLDKNHNVFWDAYDAIKVYSSNDNYVTSVVLTACNDNASSSEFSTPDLLPTNFIADGNRYAAVYPVTNDYTDGKFTVNIPETQEYDESWRFADGANPMVAFSNSTTLNFKNVYGMLRLYLYGIAPVKYIKITSLKSNENLWGKATFDFNDGNPKLVSLSDGGPTITMNVDDTDNPPLKLASEGDAREFLILLPAGTCSEGFKIRVEDPWGGYWEKEAGGSDNEIVRSQIKTMPPVTVIPYVEMCAGGPKWATMNVGAHAPWEYGDYYAWGAIDTWYTVDETGQFVWNKPDKLDGYSWKNAPYQEAGDVPLSNTKWSKYVPIDKPETWYIEDGTPDGKGELDPDDDIASQLYKGGWKIPANQDYSKLRSLCTKELTTYQGVNGYMFTSIENNAQLFFPAAGYFTDNPGTSLSYEGSYGRYWSRTQYYGYTHDAYYFLPSGNIATFQHRCDGYSVRPVL